MADNWKKGRVRVRGGCAECYLEFKIGEWAYLSPDKRPYCTRCAVDRGATVEQSPEDKAKIERFKVRLVDFIVGEIKRKL